MSIADTKSTGKKDGKDSDKSKTSPTTWKRSSIAANTSRLMIGDRDELPLKAMQMHTRVDGFRARVVIDFYFYNDRNRQFEGTFKLRLPNGASPYFMAFGQDTANTKTVADRPNLDNAQAMRKRSFEPAAIVRERRQTWIKPKIARMVPKEQAAQAYKAVVRQRVDPALMEWAGPGVFSARIFPIAPQRLHRVVVGYDMDLTRIGNSLEMQLAIPSKIPQSSIDIDIAKLGNSKITVTPAAMAQKNKTRSYYRLDDVSGKTIKVRVDGAGAIALTGNDPTTGDYFATRIRPAIPAAASRTTHDHATFIVDTSLSSNPDRFNVWLQLLRATLDNNRASIRKFKVLFFNVETFWWKQEFVANTPANVTALMTYAGTLALEGATDLGAALSEAASNAKGDVFLLSDGAVTWGEGDSYALSSQMNNAGRLFSYRTGMSGGDDSMLAHLARESGGAVFSVVGESEIAAASRAHNARPWMISRVEVQGATDVLIAGRPKTVFPGQRLVIAGRGALAAGTPITLHLTRDGVNKAVKTQTTHVVASNLATRTYGQLAVGQLDDFLGSTRRFAGVYARHFRVTGATTSLLMLESEADYKRFNIVAKDDATMVSLVTTTRLLAKAMTDLANVIGDPKAAFLSDKSVSVELRKLLDRVPTNAFRVTVPALRATRHDWANTSKQLQSQLRTRKLTYDAWTAEADRRKREFGTFDALKALSSLVEVNPGDGVLARDIGYTAMQWGMNAHAYHLFRRVAKSRPFEPQSFRALALSLANLGRVDLALAYFEVAVRGKWHSRFGDFRRIVMMDYARFLMLNQNKLHASLSEFATSRLKKLRSNLNMDGAGVVVSITWNTDNTDVDLHVIEPSGEVAFYGHRSTKSGGQMTQDVTGGYGPEMYTNRQAPKGTYKVRVKYFSSNRNRTSARTKVRVSVYKHWGTAREQVVHKVVALAYGKQMHDVATLTVK